MKKAELETIYYLLHNNCEDLLMMLETYIDSENTNDTDEINFEEGASFITGAFLEIFNAAEKFHKSSGLKLMFFEEKENISNELEKCGSDYSELDLQHEAAISTIKELQDKSENCSPL